QLPHEVLIPMHVQNLHVARGVTEHQRDQAAFVSVNLDIHRDLECEAAHAAKSQSTGRYVRQSDCTLHFSRVEIRNVVLRSVHAVKSGALFDDPFGHGRVDAQYELEHRRRRGVDIDLQPAKCVEQVHQPGGISLAGNPWHTWGKGLDRLHG